MKYIIVILAGLIFISGGVVVGLSALVLVLLVIGASSMLLPVIDSTSAFKRLVVSLTVAKVCSASASILVNDAIER